MTALGDPGDYLSPTGAARHYASDADWQAHAAALITRCRCILTVACVPTAALTWELDHVRHRGASGRLFVIIGPWSLTDGTWTAFAQELDELGYVTFAGPPAPGALLAFDRSDHMQELVTGARSPSDYVTAIAHHLTAPP